MKISWLNIYTFWSCVLHYIILRYNIIYYIILYYIILYYIILYNGPVSVVGIATTYGLNRPGIKSQ